MFNGVDVTIEKTRENFTKLMFMEFNDRHIKIYISKKYP